MPRVEIRQHNGTPTLFLDGRPEHFAALWFWPPRRQPWKFGAEIGYFRKAGVRIYNWFQVWEPPARGRTYDFRVLADHVEQIRAEDPDGLFVIKQNADAPEWWQKKHPGELERLKMPPGLTRPRPIQSYASRRWRADIQDYLRQLVEFIHQQSWGEQVLAILPCGGASGEWMTGNTNYSLDYSRPMLRHFRSWLHEQYDSVSALREVWRDPKVDFTNAAIPSWQDFNTGQDFSFREPQASQPILDYLRCLDDLVADCVIEECRAVVETARGRMFSGTYFDKTMEAYWPQGFWMEGKDYPRAIPMMLGSGNGGLMKLLRSPCVQAFASPYSYVYRGIGGDAGFMQLVETCHQHGKLVIFEDDARHWVSPIAAGEFGKPATPEETVVQITRNFGNILSRGTGLWWGYPWNKSAEEGGWSNAKVMKRVKRLAALGRFSVEQCDHRDSAAEIAVICDTESENYVKPDFQLGWSSIVRQRIWELCRMGAPYDTYHLDDLVDGRLRPYKVVIFLNAYALSPKQIRRVHRYLAAHGSTAVWVYAAGYVAGEARQEELSVENMSKATGVRLVRHDADWPAVLTVTNYEHAITKPLPEHVTFGGNVKLGPVFFADDDQAETLGTIIHWRGKCEPGLVLKEMRGWRSIWCGVPGLPACLLREIARNAGVHIWSEHDDVLYAGHNWLCVHPLKGGTRTFRLPRRTNVYDAITGRLIARSCRTFSTRLPARSAKLYYLGREKPILSSNGR